MPLMMVVTAQACLRSASKSANVRAYEICSTRCSTTPLVAPAASIVGSRARPPPSCLCRRAPTPSPPVAVINDASCRLRGAGHCPAGHLYGKLAAPTPAEPAGPGRACSAAPEPVVHLIPPAPTHLSTPFTCRPAPQEQMSHVSLAHAPRAEANSAGPRSFHWDRAEDAGAVSASDLSQYVVNPRVVWCGQWIESGSGRRQDPSSRPPHCCPVETRNMVAEQASPPTI